jgi:hypothetical protein
MTRQRVVGGHVIRQLLGLIGPQNCLVSGCEFVRTVRYSEDMDRDMHETGIHVFLPQMWNEQKDL